MKNKSFPAKLEKLHSMLFWIREQMVANHIPEKEFMKIELASEEALSNIINYAYAKKINLHVKYSEKRELEIIIMDEGIDFNPLSYGVKFNSDLPLEKREIGGLGIAMMYSLMDSIDYQRKDRKNILILKKKSNY